jgi:hypothetical protein
MEQNLGRGPTADEAPGQRVSDGRTTVLGMLSGRAWPNSEHRKESGYFAGGR